MVQVGGHVAGTCCGRRSGSTLAGSRLLASERPRERVAVDEAHSPQGAPQRGCSQGWEGNKAGYAQAEQVARNWAQLQGLCKAGRPVAAPVPTLRFLPGVTPTS